MSSAIHRKICQIVPRLPPAVDGVGDYALNLARQLRLDFGTDTCFLVSDPTWGGPNEIEGFQIAKLSSRATKSSAACLTEVSNQNPILLHYVGYGYAKRGCPTWLVDGLEVWKHQHGERLVTMFHETSASGPVWTSAFWLSALQRSLVKRLVGLSDRVLTSKQLYAEILRRIVQQQANYKGDNKLPIPALPIFSGVGEPEIILPLSQREPALVIFGGSARRLQIYQHCLDELIHACEQLNIEKIFDIGPSIELEMPKIDAVSVIICGVKAASEVSHILSCSIAGFIDYPTDFLGKSSIFASYCAHGVLPIVGRSSQGADADGLKAQFHYWLPQTGAPSISASTAQKIASDAYAWYQTHNLPSQAQIFASLLKPDSIN